MRTAKTSSSSDQWNWRGTGAQTDVLSDNDSAVLVDTPRHPPLRAVWGARPSNFGFRLKWWSHRSRLFTELTCSAFLEMPSALERDRCC